MSISKIRWFGGLSVLLFVVVAFATTVQPTFRVAQAAQMGSACTGRGTLSSQTGWGYIPLHAGRQIGVDMVTDNPDGCSQTYTTTCNTLVASDPGKNWDNFGQSVTVSETLVKGASPCNGKEGMEVFTTTHTYIIASNTNTVMGFKTHLLLQARTNGPVGDAKAVPVTNASSGLNFGNTFNGIVASSAGRFQCVWLDTPATDTNIVSIEFDTNTVVSTQLAYGEFLYTDPVTGQDVYRLLVVDVDSKSPNKATLHFVSYAKLNQQFMICGTSVKAGLFMKPVVVTPPAAGTPSPTAMTGGPAATAISGTPAASGTPVASGTPAPTSTCTCGATPVPPTATPTVTNTPKP